MASQGKCILVHLYRNTVQFDCMHDGLIGERDQSFLISNTQHEQVCANAITQQFCGVSCGIYKGCIITVNGIDDPFVHQVRGQCEITLQRKIFGHLFVGVDHHMG